MKKLIALTMISLFVFGFQVEAQRGDQGKKQVNDSKLQITAIKMSDEATKFLMEKIEWKPIFKVDGKGMIRPVKEYSIRYFSKERIILITTLKDDNPPVASSETIDLGGGYKLNCEDSGCSCTAKKGPPAKCSPESCCYGSVIIPIKNILEYETPQGNYRGSDLL
jgi:hypothetical protein